jgi:hypothetical protein
VGVESVLSGYWSPEGWPAALVRVPALLGHVPILHAAGSEPDACRVLFTCYCFHHNSVPLALVYVPGVPLFGSVA